ncbi:hypothetical protein PHLGIDRAFT_111980 [Phlebiopsis gigantea 11061_1 CR5-6]|uniref:Large ribosomal subunit protein uL5 C-terminal domain-containing protein n=1 Tax=Phlebiopsis gigantea (strain 11061_1 CR5-6) TaxID=745531 RepID=A0A0C3NDB6_PHLG1|nr:hypothetical protein PHLGIDRAFT_111980 [Phlebiopsis gigantea 11061_1 CR5-6]
MSAAPAALKNTVKTAAQSAGRVAKAAQRTRWRQILERRAKALTPRNPLKRDEYGMPIPHVNVIVRDTAQPRLADHYFNTVRDDIMYMSYTHTPASTKPQRSIRPTYDPEDPYVKHRYNPPIGGHMAWTRKPMSPVTFDSVVELERIQLHTMVKETLASRSHLLGAIMAFRAISGESQYAGGQRTTEGVQIVRGKSQIQGWVRKGIPLGVKVDLKGPKMYEFLATLTEFVFPRLRDFNGLQMPRPGASLQTASAASGVVSFGLPASAMSLFPQIEYNLDSYPKSYGMHIHFITNAQGEGAQNRVRALLSGFQIPFVRV